MLNEEAGFVDRFAYLHDSVELPMLTTTGGQILNITTPAETPAHESFAYREKCRLGGRYIKRTIEDNRHLSDAAKAKIIAQAGGRTSTTARRELFCEWVTDETRAIIPEYTEEVDAEVCASEPPPPTYELPVVGMDVGFEDLHHIVFGYYDFKRAKRIVQAEVCLQRARTDQIAQAIKETEDRLWSPRVREQQGLPELREPIRYSDVDLRLIADLAELHRLDFMPTAKDDREAQVNALRISFRNKAWHISPGCKVLRRHLRMGIWNKARTEFERTRDDGHFDAVASCLYFNRNLPIYENCYPALPPTVTGYTHHLRPAAQEPSDETDLAFDVAFGGKR